MGQPKLTTPRSGYGGRGYRIPGRDRVYPGVTTVLNQVNKGEALLQWAVDQTVAKCIMSLSYLQSVSEEIGWASQRFFWSKKVGVGFEVRRYWEGVRDDAAELGTNIHEFADADLDGLTERPPPNSIEAEEMVVAWDAFLDDHEIISHRSEFTCVNDEMGYAGTADADWTITCRHAPLPGGGYCLGAEPGPYRTLVDLKTSRHTWPEHSYQIAALASCPIIMREVTATTPGAARAQKTEKGVKVTSYWVEDAAPEWERFALLHIRPDDVDSDGRHVERFAKLIDRTQDMDLHRMGFAGAHLLAQAQHTQKARDKARGIETED